MMIKQIRNFFKSIDTSIETPVGDSILKCHIEPDEPWPRPTKDLIPSDLKPFIKKVYYKHFLQYLKTNQPQINSNDAWLEIKHSIDNYVDETMDSVADAIDSYIGWIESDIDDYAEGIFEQHEGGVKSVRKEENPFPDPPHAETCQCNDCKPLNTWNGVEWVKPEEKKETLVDWEDTDKAW